MWEKKKRTIALTALLAIGYFAYWVWNNLVWSLIKAMLLGGMIGPAIYLLTFALDIGSKTVQVKETEPKDTQTPKVWEK